MKKINVIYVFIFFKIVFTACDIAPDKSKLLSNDYRLFWNTAAWNLAVAVRNENVNDIKRIVNEEKVNVNFQESRFGQTLLMLAVENLHYNSCKALLDVGADANIHDKYNGSSPIIRSAGLQDDKSDNTRILKLLLSYGGNPNDEETGERQVGNTTRKTPLLVACSGSSIFSLDKVQTLVQAGADINHKNEYKGFPLSEALLAENYNVVLYLLQKGANYNEIIIDRAEFTKGGEKVYIIDYLKEQSFSDNGEKSQQVAKIFEFLKQKGIN